MYDKIRADRHNLKLRQERHDKAIALSCADSEEFEALLDSALDAEVTARKAKAQDNLDKLVDELLVDELLAEEVNDDLPVVFTPQPKPKAKPKVTAEEKAARRRQRRERRKSLRSTMAAERQADERQQRRRRDVLHRAALREDNLGCTAADDMIDPYGDPV